MFGMAGSRSGYGRFSRAESRVPTMTRLRRAAGQGMTLGSWFTIIWDTVDQDDVGAFPKGSTTNIIMPAGFSKMRHTITTQTTVNATFTTYMQLNSNSGINSVRIHSYAWKTAHYMVTEYYDERVQYNASAARSGLIPGAVMNVQMLVAGGAGNSSAAGMIWEIDWLRR